MVDNPPPSDESPLCWLFHYTYSSATLCSHLVDCGRRRGYIGRGAPIRADSFRPCYYSTPTDSPPTDSPPTNPPTDDGWTVECTENSDGSLTCRAEDIPGEGLDIELRCPASMDDTGDCYSCVITDSESGDQCTGCTICDPGITGDCSNLFPDEECAAMDCDGNCLNSPTPTDSPPTDPPPDDTIECSENSDDSLTCPLEDAPKEGLNTAFRCPASGETLSDCYFCAIYDTVNGDQCTDCTMCSDTASDTPAASFDCSNLDPNWECTIQDCDGNCKN